jgi:hypothetical protein
MRGCEPGHSPPWYTALVFPDPVTAAASHLPRTLEYRASTALRRRRAGLTAGRACAAMTAPKGAIAA